MVHVKRLSPSCRTVSQHMRLHGPVTLPGSNGFSSVTYSASSLSYVCPSMARLPVSVSCGFVSSRRRRFGLQRPVSVKRAYPFLARLPLSVVRSFGFPSLTSSRSRTGETYTWPRERYAGLPIPNGYIPFCTWSSLSNVCTAQCHSAPTFATPGVHKFTI